VPTNKICVICNNSAEDGESFPLTDAERKLFPDLAPITFYCTPCARVIKDPILGAQLLKGLYEMQIRGLGVPNARAVAETFHAKLLKTTTKVNNGN